MERSPHTRAAAPPTRLLSWSVALALVCFAVAMFRGGDALGLAAGGGAPLALVALVLQTGAAIAAGIGVLFARRWTWLALVVFGAGVLIEAIAHVFVYGTAPWLAALAACLVVAAALIVFALLIRGAAPAGRL
jgi:hypothetical protein